MKSFTLWMLATFSLLGCSGSQPKLDIENQLLHHVFIWLKEPNSNKDFRKLVEGMKTLSQIEVIRSMQIGQPAATKKRAVVDNSYHVSLLLVFNDVQDQKTYQEHPVHLAFVEEHQELWNKVVVYDTEKVMD